MDKIIKYPLSDEQKYQFHKRLDEVLSQTEGEQVIILWDKNRFTDYYQNTSLSELLSITKESAKEYSAHSNNALINDDEAENQEVK